MYKSNTNDIIVCLENVRSLHNIGAIIRTCEFFGIRKIILLGYSGFDPYQSDKIKPELSKTALSAINKVELLRYQYFDDVKGAFPDYQIIAVENNIPNTTLLTDFKPTTDCILVFGNETTGVTDEIISQSNIILEIKRIGTHQSLNIATAVGIVVFNLKN